ncbi:hypothetical protein quinque_001957 [Culex quinquefasciatus]
MTTEWGGPGKDDWGVNRAGSVTLQQTPPRPPPTPTISSGQKMIQNFFNFVSSFGDPKSQMVPNPSETFVPLSTVQTWFTNFERRLQQNPNFWKS